MLEKFLKWRLSPYVCVGIMTGPLVKYIGISRSVMFFIGAFLLVRVITYRIEILEAKGKE